MAGESENYGTEQEHLNNVFGARLRITALRGATGPGIELLEYLTPRDGRPFPADEHANDIVHRETILLTRDADAAAHNCNRAARTLYLLAWLRIQPDSRDRKALLVRDPDGHAIEIEEKRGNVSATESNPHCPQPLGCLPTMRYPDCRRPTQARRSVKIRRPRGQLRLSDEFTCLLSVICEGSGDSHECRRETPRRIA